MDNQSNKLKNFGYREEPIKEGIDYVLGAYTKVAGAVLNSTANWLAFKVEKEIQTINGADTFACVSFSILNCVETLANFLEFKVNYSDRFLAIASETKVGYGNSPQKVCETLRKKGVCLEVSLPINQAKSIPEFYQPDPLPENLKEEAEREFIEKFDFKHEFVFTGQESLEYKQNQLREGLKRSPLEVSVVAWFQNEKGFYYKPLGMSDNHSVSLIAYNEGKSWTIFDSVEQDVKELIWDYDFGMAKVFYLFPVSPEEAKRRKEEKLNWLEKILEAMAKIIQLFNEWLKKNSNTQPEVENETETILQPTNDKTTPETPEKPQEWTKYSWLTPAEARHSFRVICDETGLSVVEKNLLTAVLECESGFDITKTHKNPNGTLDLGMLGVIQANTYWYIDKMKLLTKDEALNDPEKCVRIFIDRYKKGFLKDWICYKNGSYKKYL